MYPPGSTPARPASPTAEEEEEARH